MISERRLRANRANALRSTGPKSTAGKARSALNAVRHGLLAKHVLVAKENPESFQTLFKMILARFSPSTTSSSASSRK